MANAIEIQNLSVHYQDIDKTVKAVDRVSLDLPEGVTLALTGESGCGKSTLALAILGLLGSNGKITGGSIRFQGRDLATLGARELREVRGRGVSMIFQDPVAGLNPVLTVGDQIEENISSHMRINKKEARRMTIETLQRMGMPDPEHLIGQYPFQLSGGMCQRVMIAIATVLRPPVLIADEPTASLDVTIQAAILNEIEMLKRKLGMSVLLISHDLGIVAQMADQVAVMYAGRIAEIGPVMEIYKRPLHPYTWRLLSTLPRLQGDIAPLTSIRGVPPDLTALPDECAFIPRCPKATLQCRQNPSPPLDELEPSHRAACYNPVFHANDE